MNNTAAIYIHKNEFSDPIATKMNALMSMAKNNNLTVIKRYVDKNSYCNPYERPAMKRLLKDVVRKKFNTVLIYRGGDIGCEKNLNGFILDTKFLNIDIKFVEKFSLTMEYMKFAEEVVKNTPKMEIDMFRIETQGKALQLKLKHSLSNQLINSEKK